MEVYVYKDDQPGFLVTTFCTKDGEYQIERRAWEKVAQDAWNFIFDELPAGMNTVGVAEAMLDEMKTQLKRLNVSTL